MTSREGNHSPFFIYDDSSANESASKSQLLSRLAKSNDHHVRLYNRSKTATSGRGIFGSINGLIQIVAFSRIISMRAFDFTLSSREILISLYIHIDTDYLDAALGSSTCRPYTCHRVLAKPLQHLTRNELRTGPFRNCHCDRFGDFLFDDCWALSGR